LAERLATRLVVGGLKLRVLQPTNQFPRSTARRYATIFLATARVARLAFPFCFPFHRSEPVHGSVWAPAWRLRPVRAGYACCAVSKEVCAAPCLRNSFLLRRARNS